MPDAPAKELIAKSRAALWRQRYTLFGGVGIVILLVALAIFSVVTAISANNLRRTTQASVWALNAEKILLQGGDALDAAELAVQSYQLQPTIDGERALYTVFTSPMPVAEMRGHTGGVASAAFSPDGTKVVTASWDSTARVWDATSGDQLALLEGYTGGVYSAAFSPDGSRVVTASEDGTARIWLIDPDEILEILTDRLTHFGIEIEQ